MKTSAIAGLLCGLVALSGCAPAGPSVTPAPASPSPTYLCTPESGGTPAPCTESEFQAMQAKDALYAEAEQVYRAYYAESIRLFRNGEPASDELLRYLDGEAEQQALDDHSRGGRMTAGDFKIAWIRRLPGVSTSGSVVALESCTDGSATTLLVDGRQVGRGRIAKERTYFAGSLGDLAIVASDFEVVPEC